jgi:hypothetical protein
MEFLKTYVRAAAGRRVILTIHQPSSFIWQMLDNVVLLSKGKLMYEGPRQNIEAFFAANEHRTPAGWNPADHYVIMVNDEFRDHAKSVKEWAKCYTRWELSHHLGGQNSAAIALSDAEKGDQKGRTSSMVALEYNDAIKTQRSNSFYDAVYELTYRYFLNLWFNPGILFTRVAMYTMLGKCLYRWRIFKAAIRALNLTLSGGYRIIAIFSSDGRDTILGFGRASRL